MDKAAKTISYRIRHGGTKEERTTAEAGTTTSISCIMSDADILYDYIRKADKSGKMDQQLIVIVAERKSGRAYV